MATEEERTAYERNFAEHLRRVREARGVSQSELARLATAYGSPMRQQTITRIETGRQNITLDQAGALSMALGWELVDMLRPPEATMTADEVSSEMAAAQSRVEELEAELAEAVRQQERARERVKELQARLVPVRGLLMLLEQGGAWGHIEITGKG